MSKKNIEVEGLIIRIEPIHDKDYISLTDIAKKASEEKPAYTIQNWIRNNNTIRYLAKWEEVHNGDLKVVHLHDLLETVLKPLTGLQNAAFATTLHLFLTP